MTFVHFMIVCNTLLTYVVDDYSFNLKKKKKEYYSFKIPSAMTTYNTIAFQDKQRIQKLVNKVYGAML